MIMVFVFIFVLVIVSEDSIGGTVYSSIGESAVLVCNINSQAISYRWRKNNHVLSYGSQINNNTHGYDRYKIINSGETYSLRILNISLEDFGLYLCSMQLNQKTVEKRFFLKNTLGKYLF